MKYCIALLLLVACSFSSIDLELKRGEEAEEKQDYKSAVEHYKRVIKREPKSDIALYSSKKVANISVIYLENFQDAIFAFNNIILFSSNIDDRRKAIEQLAKLYYEKLNNYEFAIVEFQRYLAMITDESKILEIRFLIAKSYFYLNRMFQANAELDEILKLKAKDTKEVQDYVFKATTLKASILHAQKKYEDAIEMFSQIIEDYPKQALDEKIWLNLLICLEDTKRFTEAIELLEKVEVTGTEKTFVEQKIVRLRERMKLEPGAKGFKK
ncbi:MAG: tetratricopeptide repeat protein [Bdellovibrionales bacterium]|nr:tetratricopeptide repeat protein [Bdellovibrionales bacterium]